MISKIHAAEPDRISLAQLPTPLVELANLSKSLGKCIWMKRDDLTGLELSGNKIRKLEYVLADAKASGADTIVTFGGYQSNHCRATAAAGARLGMRVRLVLRAPNDPDNEGNLFMDRMFGAEISLHSPAEFNANRAALVESAMNDLRSRGQRPYYFPVGASIPLGCWGYIRCVHELSQQIDPAKMIDLYVPVSSSGTYVGVLLGIALLGLRNWRAIGVPVSDTIEFFQNDLRQLAHATIEKYQLGLLEDQIKIDLLHGYIGEGYAIPTPAALETTRLLARSEGILVDPTYTSKALTGMLDCVRDSRTRDGATPVFLHTGGVFGLFARRDLFPEKP